jgi:serine/threonine protein kinase
VHDQRATLVFGGARTAAPTPAPPPVPHDPPAADDPDAPRLPRYRVGRLVGAGGMGRVYEAVDTVLERPVALKVMRADVPASERRRFRREAILGARLLHPGLVRVYDMGHGADGEAEWMAMEFLPGTDLLRLLDGARARRQPLRWPAIVRAVCSVLGALQYLHDCGIVHRDIKPANMFLTRDPNTRFLTTKLLDLGVALDLDGPAPARAVETLCGDPNYIAPEQTQTPHVDGRADIYSVGVSLYELTTGVLPFQTLTDAPLHELLAAHREREPRPPSTRLPPGTPLALAARIDRVFATACTKDPARRFASAREMADALAAPLDEELTSSEVWEAVDLDDLEVDPPAS